MLVVATWHITVDIVDVGWIILGGGIKEYTVVNEEVCWLVPPGNFLMCFCVGF